MVFYILNLFLKFVYNLHLNFLNCNITWEPHPIISIILVLNATQIHFLFKNKDQFFEGLTFLGQKFRRSDISRLHFHQIRVTPENQGSCSWGLVLYNANIEMADCLWFLIFFHINYLKYGKVGSNLDCGSRNRISNIFLLNSEHYFIAVNLESGDIKTRLRVAVWTFLPHSLKGGRLKVRPI